MRHKLGYRKLNRNSSQRRALLRGLATGLVVSGRVVTTLEKAKALRPYVEKLITKAKVDTPVRRAAVSAQLFSGESVSRLFKVVAPSCTDRSGGYLRIVKLGFRPGDNARIALVEFVSASLLPSA